MLINPVPKVDNGKLTVKEGETIGPYNCSADCNPPCDVKWRYIDTAGKIQDALSPHIATRNITEFRCVAIYMHDENYTERYTIDLNVQCKYHFTV